MKKRKRLQEQPSSEEPISQRYDSLTLKNSIVVISLLYSSFLLFKDTVVSRFEPFKFKKKRFKLSFVKKKREMESTVDFSIFVIQ